MKSSVPLRKQIRILKAVFNASDKEYLSKCNVETVSKIFGLIPENSIYFVSAFVPFIKNGLYPFSVVSPIRLFVVLTIGFFK